MEKLASGRYPAAGAALLQQLSPQDWETLIDDFQSGVPGRRARWLSVPLLDLALNAILRRDFPSSLKPHLLVFLEESLPLLPLPSPAAALPPLLDALRVLLQSPSPDAAAVRDQAILSVTAIAVAALPSPLLTSASPELESLAEVLLAVANRPNHGPDRLSRALACESLRELERANPLLLSDVAGHLWALAQAERTHAAQSYLLLLAAVIRNIALHGLLSSPSSILSTSTPLVPFSVPQSLFSSPDPNREPSDLNLREIRRVMAFLLERPHALTPPATMELVSMLTSIAGVLEQRVPAVTALLKVQFSGLLYSYDPILCHVVLMLYSRFSDAFSGEDERGIARRLALVARETHHPLIFRLLALHWLLGLPRIADGKASLAPLTPNFYPTVFDPLALKAKKLDVLSCVAASLDVSRGERKEEEEGRKAQVVKLFEDGLVCVSAFKWLPPWSTETSVAFRTLHNFLIGVAPHRNCSSENSEIGELMESTIFHTIQNMLVSLSLEHHGLVPVIATFVDRLLACQAHRQVGEWLLQTLDEHLLPKLESGYQLVSYFPIFGRIAESDTIPPRGLLELLTRHMVTLSEKHGPDTWLRSWSQGSKVLGICRMMLKHHHSSRVFLALSHLLTFTCQFFPDLEVRDNARIYLRMLLCIPGKKLRHIMNLVEQPSGVSPSPHPGSLFQVPSPRHAQDLKKSVGVSSYIHLERVIPLLVKQSWSLTLPNLSNGDSKSSYVEGIKDISAPPSTELGGREPLRVMDSKVAEILGVLRRHFACIPDYRHMPAIKIRIPCRLRFDSEPFTRVWGAASFALDSEEVDGLPALYATTITFSSTSKYGSIPPCRVPFLLGEPSRTGFDIVPVDDTSEEEDSSFRASVMIELEPQEPVPGLIDVAIKANAENGQIISGSLQNITVGIEDMFLKAVIPPDIMEDRIPEYYMDLFHALWEACGNSANTGRETFPLSGGKGAVAINGTQSVKLLEVFAYSLIRAIERYLAPFVVSVIGNPLVNVVKDNGVIRDVVWGEDSENFADSNVGALVPYSDNVPLQLPYTEGESDADSPPQINKRNMGIFLVLIFLPPQFHLLFQMEVSDASTLVRIRTDHWPCLAYVDEYLEALFLT
uniref:Uncharacterized protein LOC105055407 n=1 Tax=Elaeis guineensis var. tenera TaxID=51953 RepID=A0A8N4F2Q1_ELAGV|nr:uncharacterized protein LOC105055407 [Elaeis guineensis]